jgi:uncharacterized membrane protein YhaH (DUF805 family)
MQWYFKVLHEYANFAGRARRTEFWMFVLVSFGISVVLAIIDSVVGLQLGVGVGVLRGLYWLAVLIPSIAVGARRLHDTGRSAWWLLLSLIPLVGTIVLIVFWASEGTPTVNVYGPNPKQMATSHRPTPPVPA